MTTVIARTAAAPPPTDEDGFAPGYGPGARLWGRVGPVRPSDGPALAALFADCSPETVRLRFFAPVPALPREYVEAVLAGRPEAHDAVAAYGPGPEGRGRLIGLGSLAAAGTDDPARGEYPPAEIGLLVADAWQRQGVGAAMLDVLLARARSRGVTRVSAFVLPGRSALLGVLTRRLEPEGFARDGDGLTGVYRLSPPDREGLPTA